MPKTEIEFIRETRHQAEFTFNSLDDIEFSHVKRFAEWDEPAASRDFIASVMGRSITLYSPTKQLFDEDAYVHGTFDGIQIIGACGSADMILDGVFDAKTHISVSPFIQTNHAEYLWKIIQLRDFDTDGKLMLTDRTYAPLHGMDTQEAINRKQMTAYVAGLKEKRKKTGFAPFTPPVLAADGIFPDSSDPHGNPLHFQAYRVPLVERFPAQFVTAALELCGPTALNILTLQSYFIGVFDRVLHEHGKAYMDGHIGNTSLLSGKHGYGIFVTDLGSIKEISAHPHRYKFMALDTYMFVESTRKLIEMTIEYMKTQPGMAIDAAEFGKNLLLRACYGFMGGYLGKGFDRDNTFSLSRMLDEIKFEGNHLLTITRESNTYEDWYVPFLNLTSVFLSAVAPIDELTQ